MNCVHTCNDLKKLFSIVFMEHLYSFGFHVISHLSLLNSIYLDLCLLFDNINPPFYLWDSLLIRLQVVLVKFRNFLFFYFLCLPFLGISTVCLWFCVIKSVRKQRTDLSCLSSFGCLTDLAIIFNLAHVCFHYITFLFT